MSAKKRTVSGAISGLLAFIGMSAVAGVLVTVAVTPALALSGMTATNTINVFENMPDYLSIDQLAQKSNIYAKQADGTPVLLASFYQQNRVEVASDAISQFVKDAAVTGEDPRFFEHGGIDLQGTVSGAVSTLTGGATRGGSSITQQYVKNVLVQKCEAMNDADKRKSCYNDATEVSIDRKLKEMRLAIGVDKNYAKEDILRQYLNITGFGGTVYGIEAAANYYFNTTAADLTLPQSASLVAIVNNPVKYQLDRPDSETNGAANGYADNKVRRDYILGEMLQYKKISQEDHDAAVASPIEPTITTSATGCQAAGANAYFCNYVTHVLKNDPTFGKDADTRLSNFRRGGYDVFTTLDLDLQNAAIATLDENVPKTMPNWDVGGVVSSVGVGTGKVLAMAQNKDYTQDPNQTGDNFTAINYNTDQNTGGSLGFQPGSTYKVFTLAEWLKAGHTLNERVDSSRKSNWGTFEDSCDGPQTFPGFNPRNDANESGRNYSALQSTIGSINTGFIGMSKELDLCAIRSTAEAFDVHRADGGELEKGASAVLGTNEIAPLTMATAFAGIANNGSTCTPIAIESMVAADGTDLPVPKSVCTQSVEPEVAAGMTYAMSRVMTSGTAQQSYAATSPRVPVIGKTGTTDSAKDTWMSGSSSNVATVVGVVNVSGTYQNQRTTRFPSGYASTARHRMWPDIMSVANAKYGGDAFMEASNAVLRAVQVKVPDLRGKSMSEAKSKLTAAGFEFTDSGAIDSALPEGTVASTNPAGGTTADRGSTVRVSSSNGSGVVIPDTVGKTEAEAKAILTAAPYEFKVTKTDQDVTDPNQNGKVISMSPEGGTGAKPGAAVTIVVGKMTPPAAGTPPGQAAKE
ncbi:transglycosylase domain-containing protein [Cryobacterium psychrophilum]|uniref:PASTA domain-containing protein n=1 Tax=Cryobacterium psychrophilum TaxID=41988 RepID=A0A4Y8KMR0_9MICO|nr:transglycosylase domain-containing protein [Cryobacterium psychrophilum]TDW30588.1 membrane peptidoglycan carboxypeptidase [Cryobacterium psychrophilum]TFD77014.1 PASTA domain-containing protein [Cryobacterium psychrophilum]